MIACQIFQVLSLQAFTGSLKAQVNSLNLIIIIALLSVVFYKLNRKRTATVLAVLASIVFILFSTNYLPAFLITRIESTYAPFQIQQHSSRKDKLYVHVLGGGYTLDQRFPANAQLSPVSLGRLVEGIRVLHLYDSSVLVLSGTTVSGDESMASVARKAAISLGVDASRIAIMNAPSTTAEEAKGFADRYGDVPVVVVTDAVHMPRAMRFFNDHGIHPFAAPTNYIIKQDDNMFALRWMPAANNFLLMDRVLREFFGSLKGIL